ncbi:MAG: helix-turn-helix transcriptional regulator [Nitrosomonas sp.]|uniref:helix-turn-helix domain-containing protein n=1 Tax=Nitrosomonas sp. TaxID=42353 RepID=UPI002ABBA3AB|nr:helix-turn-helix transcriptional regulator [Nitrosomonas sp.]MDZ4105706.1 helix-turn-helix transcriptional regulator [Nitrosomonas sp.]
MIQDLNHKAFGRRLRAFRKPKGIYQDELALRAEIDRSYVGWIERGEVRITLEKAHRLPTTLGCDIRDLLS